MQYHARLELPGDSCNFHRLTSFQAKRYLWENVWLLNLGDRIHAVKPVTENIQKSVALLHGQSTIPKHWLACQRLGQVWHGFVHMQILRGNVETFRTGHSGTLRVRQVISRHFFVLLKKKQVLVDRHCIERCRIWLKRAHVDLYHRSVSFSPRQLDALGLSSVAVGSKGWYLRRQTLMKAQTVAASPRSALN